MHPPLFFASRNSSLLQNFFPIHRRAFETWDGDPQLINNPQPICVRILTPMGKYF
jgi:hypothetical protein